MGRNLRALLAIPLLLLAACGVDGGALDPTPISVVPGQYIVVLEGGAARHDAQAFTARVDALATDHGVLAAQRLAIVDAFVVRGLDAAGAERLATDPRVAYLEPDQVTRHAAASWGLDRIDQRALPLDQRYGYGLDGAGVSVYVLDTGIRADHVEFGGRVAAGHSVIHDGYGSDDPHGHGTHVAATIGGASFGVAPGVTLLSVRVLGADGTGTVSSAIAGLEWVAGVAGTGPAVANLSLGAGASSSLDAAIAAVVNAGVSVVVAAGNDDRDACEVSPARSSHAVTVGASTSADERASFSNRGSCVDLFAPGAAIRSAYAGSASASATMSGTSMAAPHVSGALAQALQAAPTATPDELRAALLADATTGALSSLGAGSPDRLLFVQHGVCVDCTAVDGVFDGPRQSHVYPRDGEGSYRTTVTSRHDARLEALDEGADFELYLERWTGSDWETVAASSRSGGGAISVSAPAGVYRWHVFSHRSSGAYRLYVDQR